MGSGFDLLEGIGRGRMDRIVMGKLGMDIDLLGGIQELAKKGRDSNRGDPIGCWSLGKGNL